MNYYLLALKKYFIFSGRSKRLEYWVFYSLNFILFLILGVIATAIPSTTDIIKTLGGVLGLVLLIPSMAVSIRRLHDIGKSGWGLLIQLIPIIGSILLLVLMLTKSNPGDNQYGPNPKGTIAPQINP